MPLHSCTAAERISVLTNFHGLSKMRTSVSDEPVRSSARDWFNFFRKKVFGYNKLPKISSDEFSESNPEYSIREGNSDEGMNRFVLGAALIASISSTLLGYDVGVTTGALLFIEEDFHLTDFQKEVFVSSLSLISLFGALISGRLSDAVGRRKTILLASIIFLAGSTVMALSSSYAILMIGRLITGVGVGFGFTSAPLYTAELAPPSKRGMLVSLSEVFINSGILLGYLASFALESLPEGINWRVMLALGGIPAFLLGIGVLSLPESPRWLVLKGRLDEAKAVLEKTGNGKRGEAEERLKEIVESLGGQYTFLDSKSFEKEWASVESNDSVEIHSSLPGMQRDKVGSSEEKQTPNAETGGVLGGENEVWKELLNPSEPVKRMLWVCIGTNIFQQATGIDAAVYYSPVVFEQAGIRGKAALLGATVAIGFVKTIFILVAMGLLDLFGRRPLLLISTSGMTVALLFESFGFFLLRQNGSLGSSSLTSANPPPPSGLWAPAIIVFSSCLFVASFSIGLGPINWVLTSEIFPLRLRAQAFSLGTAVNRLVSGAVALTFLSLGDSLSPAGCFFTFACIGALSILFFYKYAPETKGKTLEEIEKLFDQKVDNTPKMKKGYVGLVNKETELT